MKTNDLFKTHPLLSDRVRLAIMATLAAENSALPFTDLAERLELTRGNLSAHIRKLEAEGLVEVKKEFIDRKPCTSYFCTEQGLAALRNYLEQVESLLKQTRS